MPSEILTPVEFDDGLMNVVEINARLCYLSEPGGDRTKFLKKLLVAGHWSVFEHANVSVVFRDVSRGMTHQLVLQAVTDMLLALTQLAPGQATLMK